MLRFAEEILLLLLDEERGDVSTRVSTNTLNIVLAGALLMDLALEGRIDTDPDKLVVSDAGPVGDPLLDYALDDIRQATDTHDTGYWIRHFVRQGHTIRRMVVNRLVERGILEPDVEGRILLSRMISLSRRYPLEDGTWLEEVRLRVIRVLFSDEIPGPRDIAIICLADACNLFSAILDSSELSTVRERIELLSRMDLIGRSVGTSLRDIATAHGPRAEGVSGAGFLSLRNLRKGFDGSSLIRIAELDVVEGEVLALLGPSGCGKTTTLRMVAGLSRPESGSIAVAGRVVDGPGIHVPAERRNVGMVFQDYALFPHLTVEGNIRFGLDGRSADSAGRARDMMELTRLTHLANRRPAELSGGEQQRTALARSLAPNPHLLLLDEPFSSLDAALRKDLRREVRRILQDTGITTILVTHDQDEALSMCDRLALILEGEVQQVGTPQELYWSPRNEKVARFIGDVNLLPGMADGSLVVDSVLGRLPVQEARSGSVQIMLRPESVQVFYPEDEASVMARVLDVEYYGHDQVLNIRLQNGEKLLVRRDAIQPFLPGQTVSVRPVGVFPVYEVDTGT